ncbi:hypothetical protein VB796_06675 [Arcicella sp. LKC2W]|uniref:hypothetical protein n=1 Tax=Arcicella sp. LKC2W TaxID=2984198 RepID=UPI002B211D1C|nr:hypothetical protein [Arcicella sp. LKC2W]MEA5458712.1 hypothetical protein [Arcicella sp. LKC2W]
MTKSQALLTDLSMKRASILMYLRNLQESEENYDEQKVNELLDTLNKLQKGIEVIENHLKNGGE